MRLDRVVRGKALCNRRQKVAAEYSARLGTNTGRISLTVRLRGSDMIAPRASGTCKPMK